MELQVTQTRHLKSVADERTDRRTDRQTDGWSGPTTRPAFAKATQVKTVLNPPVNGKIQGLFKAFECFQVPFKANLIFKDFSTQSCIFKYFSRLGML